jgi:hypothetical protein
MSGQAKRIPLVIRGDTEYFIRAGHEIVSDLVNF